MNRFLTRRSELEGFKKLLSASLILFVFFQAIAPGAFDFKPKVAQADAGLAAALNMFYNPVTGQLTAFGNWTWTASACKPGSTKNVGIALFINGANPNTSISSNNVLDKTVHLVPDGTPCTTPSGTWVDNSHDKTTNPVLATQPNSVCVFAYDLVKAGNPAAFPATGNHSAVTASTGSEPKHNGDNSLEANNLTLAQYLAGSSCVTPTVLPTITVNKVVVNDNGGTKVVADFPLSVTKGSNTFSVTSGAKNVVTPGTWTVSETSSSGYSASFSGDCDANGNVVLSGSQNKTCTITNDDISPQLTINKTVINDNEDQPGTSEASDFNLFAGLKNFINGVQAAINAGIYTISETGPSGYTPSFSGDCSGGSVTLGLGDIKVCNITNNDNIPPPPTKGTLTVIKNVVNDNGGTGEVGDFDLSVNEDSVISGEAAVLDAGTYTVSEGAHAGYTSTISGDCNPEDGSISIVAGHDYTCTITNDDIPGTLIVKKVIVGSDAPYDDFSFAINGGESENFDEDGQNDVTVNAGTYTVTEKEDDGYQTTYDNCEGVLVENGGEATCTITNTALGHIIVNKVTNLNETDQNFDFTTEGDGYNPFSLQSGGSNDQALVPGEYTVSEDIGSLPAGWALTSLHCVYPESEESVGISVPPSGEEIDLEAGETVTCTFTNTFTPIVQPKGTLIVHKVAVGGDAVFEFDGSGSLGFFTVETEEGTGSKTFNNLSPDFYTLEEEDLPIGWHQTGNTCDDNDGGITVSADHVTECTITNTYTPTSDLGVTKTVGDEEENVSVDSGSNVTFAVKVTNNGPDNATGVTVNDLLPAGLAYVSDDGAGTYSSSTGVWTVGNLANGDTATLHITATASGAGDQVITNTATTIDAVLEDSNDSDSATVTINKNDSHDCRENCNEVPLTGNVIVNKVVVNDDGGTSQVSDFPLFVGSTSVTSGASNSFNVGDYVVSETFDSSKYAQSFSGDCDASGNISVANDTTKTCVITNNDIKHSSGGHSSGSSSTGSVLGASTSNDPGQVLGVSTDVGLPNTGNGPLGAEKNASKSTPLVLFVGLMVLVGLNKASFKAITLKKD